MPFLLDVFRIPADTFQLFLATGVINQRFGSLLAAVHTVVVGLLGSAAIAGAVRFDVRRITRYLVITLCLVVGVLGSLRLLFETALRPTFDGAAVVSALKPVLPRAPLTDAAGVAASPGRQQLCWRRSRPQESVRVCYLTNARRTPSSTAIANWSGSTSRWRTSSPSTCKCGCSSCRRQPTTSRTRSRRDDATSAPAVSSPTPGRAAVVAFSTPYMQESLAFVVPDHLRDDYDTWNKVRARRSVRIGFPDVPYFRRQLEQRLPEATLVPVTAMNEVFTDKGWAFEALVLSAERGAFLSLLYPGYSVVVPTPGVITVPVAYALPEHDPAWKSFVDTWLELHQRDGAITTLVDHWVFGKSLAPPTRRWSVIRNVLHWVD